MDEILLTTLRSLDSAFQENELAYLALTTKIELPFRDRWAYTLHQQLSEEFIVSREWRRTDLVLLQDREPVALVELKAMYTFDAALDPTGISGFCDRMEKDELSAQTLAAGSAPVYTVLLATHPKSIVPVEYDRVIKYRQGINRALNRFGGPHQVEAASEQAVSERLKGKNIIARGKVPGGSAFGIDVDVCYWVVRAA